MAFSAIIGSHGALAGIDLGTKTVGIAVSDGLRSVATPVETLRRGKFSKDSEDLRTLFGNRGVVGVVMGLPMNMDGSEGPRAQSARAYARNIARVLSLPVALWDERLSTVAAERALLDADMSRAKRAVLIDHVAASYILQGVLDRLGHLKRSTAHGG
nr:Holliday junction resolvase RuvX [Rubricella aquisinus]